MRVSWSTGCAFCQYRGAAGPLASWSYRSDEVGHSRWSLLEDERREFSVCLGLRFWSTDFGFSILVGDGWEIRFEDRVGNVGGFLQQSIFAPYLQSAQKFGL